MSTAANLLYLELDYISNDTLIVVVSSKLTEN